MQVLLYNLEIFEFGKMSPKACEAHRQLWVKMESVITLQFIYQFTKLKKLFILSRELKGVNC